ncbi:MAG TPA: glycosyl transferase family 2, partial [Methyloceanibacter sp.]|nr:glycosyl transferase family 2 [Methyloceanibacter sp.]
SRKLYRALGGFRPMPLMEDVDLMRRLKRRQLVMLHSRAVTSGVRYRSEGYVSHSLRNLCCTVLYFLRVPPRVLARLYG